MHTVPIHQLLHLAHLSKHIQMSIGTCLFCQTVSANSSVQHTYISSYLHLLYVHRCWISEENGAIWAFLGPMLLIIVV